jgi:hypothetical protein
MNSAKCSNLYSVVCNGGWWLWVRDVGGMCSGWDNWDCQQVGQWEVISKYSSIRVNQGKTVDKKEKLSICIRLSELRKTSAYPVDTRLTRIGGEEWISFSLI